MRSKEENMLFNKQQDEYDQADYDELDDMQSPISRRKEIAPDLDDDEEQFFEAFNQYREGKDFNDFTHYKDYYQDA